MLMTMDDRMYKVLKKVGKGNLIPTKDGNRFVITYTPKDEFGDALTPITHKITAAELKQASDVLDSQYLDATADYDVKRKILDDAMLVIK